MRHYSGVRLTQPLTFCTRHLEILKSLSIIVFILALAAGSASASSASELRTSTSPDCHVVEPDADYSVDVHALDNYGTFIRHLLVQERYDALDCIADSARANKTKFSGGFWKLHMVYMGLSHPVEGDAHATEDDWKDHIDQLKRWMSAKPNSITARIALAQAYIGYAWMARGVGFADSITENGARLIVERTNEAEAILKEAYELPTKCPEWYLTMQALVQLQGTDKENLTALLERAIAFEPTYQYFYRLHADLLASKWYGEDGDEENFVQQAADRVGRTEGDILYFQIAAHVLCPCNDKVDLKLMSWPRMQKGFAALTQRSGPSLLNTNLLAYMAVREHDATFADQTFTRIGGNWDPDVWGTKSFFDENKKWAAGVSSTIAWEKSLDDQADADMRTPEGIKIKKKFDEKFAARIQQCAALFTGPELEPFAFFVTVGKKGEISQIIAFPATKVSDCVVKQGRLTLLRPRHSPFWLKIEVDPAKVMTASVQ